jgi:2-polyprenyl-6-methoxyphenol hydroxylase-like FAD-dependent oxidoreductase
VEATTHLLDRVMKIIILGAGIAGLTTALALTKWLPEAPDIIILETRPQPSTIGGAIGLTPNAQRCLYHLGVLPRIQAKGLGIVVDKIELFTIYTGTKLGHIDFTGDEGNGLGEPALKGLRIMRADLLQSVVDAIRSLSNIKLEYGRHPTRIQESLEGVAVDLVAGTMSADLVIGCDGIHSFTRTTLVDPERIPVYTGIAAVFGFADLQESARPPWQDTGLCQSQRGSLMTTYYEATRSRQYIAAIMETKEVLSREGWLAQGSQQDKIKHDVSSRYAGSAIKFLDPLIKATDHWTLYPVYKLAPKGKWCSKRTILLGDAAHAMPPQGESAGHALEDAILFARVMQHSMDKGLDEVFSAYERVRRGRIDQAYAEAVFGWETQKDSGWFTFVLRNWFTSWYLWWTSTSRCQRYKEDVATMRLE